MCFLYLLFTTSFRVLLSFFANKSHNQLIKFLLSFIWKWILTPPWYPKLLFMDKGLLEYWTEKESPGGFLLSFFLNNIFLLNLKSNRCSYSCMLCSSMIRPTNWLHQKGLEWLVISPYTFSTNLPRRRSSVSSFTLCGKISLRKQEPLESDREALSSYTLIWCTVGHNLVNPSNRHFFVWSHTWWVWTYS